MAHFEAGAAAANGEQMQQELPPLVMQLIVDRQLVKEPGWSTGPLMAQAAHAAIAIVQESSERPSTRAYVSPDNLSKMHKVVLQTPANMSLAELSKRLDAARETSNAGEGASGDEKTFPPHHLWMEQPEGVPTCIAVAPNRKPPALKKVLNKCSLLRD